MRKTIAVTAGSLIFLAGYVAGVIYKLIPHWLIISLAPFAVICVVIALVVLGGYAILLAALVSDFVEGKKEKFLLKFGTETQAIIVKSETYYGPGLHKGDPCFKGEYSFTDIKGRKHVYKFSRECYDPYDLNSLDSPIDAYYQKGSERRLIYWRWVPSIHYLYGPDTNVPILRGRFGLYSIK